MEADQGCDTKEQRKREGGERERERGGGKKLGVVENITLKAGQVRSQ